MDFTLFHDECFIDILYFYHLFSHPVMFQSNKKPLYSQQVERSSSEPQKWQLVYFPLITQVLAPYYNKLAVATLAVVAVMSLGLSLNHSR